MSVRILLMRSRKFDEVWPDKVLDGLKRLGDVTVQTEPIPRDAPDASAHLASLMRETKPEILIIGWGLPRFSPALLREHPQLKFIQHTAGTVRDYLERETFAEPNAPLVANWGEVVAPAVAEAGLMMTLAGLRRVSEAQLNIHMKSGWGGTPALTLFDRPVATHGLGAIAQEFVKLLQPFRCPVAAYSPSVPDSVFAELGVRRVHTLAELYAEHDVVVCHAGSTPKTHHIVNRDILTRLPDGALFVNTARGEVVDSDALIAELKKNRIWAALDVFEGEPLAVDSPLRGLPNCLLMPHTGGPTADWLWRMGQTAADNVARYVRGLEPKNLITLAVFDRST